LFQLIPLLLIRVPLLEREAGEAALAERRGEIMKRK
jgi:hypothetical protein